MNCKPCLLIKPQINPFLHSHIDCCLLPARKIACCSTGEVWAEPIWSKTSAWHTVRSTEYTYTHAMDNLPDALILKIVSILDIHCLQRVACASARLRELCAALPTCQGVELRVLKQRARLGQSIEDGSWRDPLFTAAAQKCSEKEQPPPSRSPDDTTFFFGSFFLPGVLLLAAWFHQPGQHASSRAAHR